MTPIICMACRKCGKEVETWIQLHSKREQAIKEVVCPQCGENIWQIKPARFSWSWGEQIKSRE